MSDYSRVQGVISQQGNNLDELCNTSADVQGMPPQVIVACAIAESNIDEHAERWGQWPDVSFGAWQQTVAYAPIGDGTASASNVAYVREQLFNVNTAVGIAAPQLGNWWKQYGQYQPTLDDGVMETLGRYNYPWVGYSGNPNAANIARATAASHAYLTDAPAGDTGALAYDPHTSPDRQTYDWTCSANTAYWMLRSVGVAVPEKVVFVEQMVEAGLITQEWGLMDGSGTALAEWLSGTFGVDCRAYGALSWEWLQAHAGRGPVGMGSSTMYHWLAVREMASPALSSLMNPAPGYRGVYDDLTEAQFSYFAPWSGIGIVAAAEEDPQVIAELETQVAQLEADKVALQDEIGHLHSLLGYVCVDAAGAAASALYEVRSQLGAEGVPVEMAAADAARASTQAAQAAVNSIQSTWP